MKTMLIRGAAALAGTLCAAAASAQSFPSKPVRIIVPYVGGGAVDASGGRSHRRVQDLLHRSVPQVPLTRLTKTGEQEIRRKERTPPDLLALL